MCACTNQDAVSVPVDSIVIAALLALCFFDVRSCLEVVFYLDVLL